MSHVRVAFDALDLSTVGLVGTVRLVGRAHVGREVGVTTHTVGLQYLLSRGFDFNGLLEVSGRKHLTVAPAVFCLHQVLVHKLLREMAIDTHRHGMMS